MVPQVVPDEQVQHPAGPDETGVLAAVNHMNVMLTRVGEYQQKTEHAEDQPARKERVEEPDLRTLVHSVRLRLRDVAVNG